MKRFPTPTLDGIAAAPRCFQLRTWLAIAAKETNGLLLLRNIERLRGYLDCLEDSGAITSAEWAAASAELNGWIRERC